MRPHLTSVSAVVLMVLALAACGDDDTVSTSSIDATAGNAPVIDDPVVAEPTVAAPGELVELTFPTELERGAPWYMSKWNGEDWTEPMYLLTASTDGYRPAGGPSWRPASEEWGWEDIGLGGPGPDTIVVPDTADDGEYRLCTANARVPACVNIEVAAQGNQDVVVGEGGASTTSPELEPVTYGGDLVAGEPRSYQFWTHCGIEWLGQFDGAEWKLQTPETDDDLSGVPTEWTKYITQRTDEEIDVRLELLDDERLVVQPIGSPDDLRAMYQRTIDPNPGCD